MKSFYGMAWFSHLGRMGDRERWKGGDRYRGEKYRVIMSQLNVLEPGTGNPRLRRRP